MTATPTPTDAPTVSPPPRLTATVRFSACTFTSWPARTIAPSSMYAWDELFTSLMPMAPSTAKTSAALPA